MYDPTLGPDAPQALALQTRKGGTVTNFMNPTPMHQGVDIQIADLKNKYTNAQGNIVAGFQGKLRCRALLMINGLVIPGPGTLHFDVTVGADVTGRWDVPISQIGQAQIAQAQVN